MPGCKRSPIGIFGDTYDDGLQHLDAHELASNFLSANISCKVASPTKAPKAGRGLRIDRLLHPSNRFSLPQPIGIYKLPLTLNHQSHNGTVFLPIANAKLQSLITVVGQRHPRIRPRCPHRRRRNHRLRTHGIHSLHRSRLYSWSTGMLPSCFLSLCVLVSRDAC